MRKISGDIRNVKGTLDHFFNDCVGAGRAGELLRRTAVEQLEEVSRSCGFRYLRFHGLFSDDMGVYQKDENGNPIYNWQYVDHVYDAILDSGMKPFVELSFTPHAMASGTQELFWWRANVTVPASMDDWYELIHRFTRHMTGRYGEAEVKTWRFEVWNEPNHPSFFSGDLADYLNMYDTAVRAVKDVCASYQVGGPATAGCAWIPELLEHCHEKGIPVDFVTTHTYGVRGDFDEDGKKLLYLLEDKNYIEKSVRQVKEQVKASAFPDLPVYFTEWSASYSSRDSVHDSYIEASYLLYHLKRVSGLADSMSYWTFTDVFEELGNGLEPFHGGFGLMNLQSYKKPAYHAYWMLNQLGDMEVENSDSDSFICKTGEDDIQVLWWDYELPKQDIHNAVYFKRDLVPESAKDVEILLEGLPRGRYQVSLYQTGYGIHDIYTEYLHSGILEPSRQEEEIFREKSQETPVSVVRKDVCGDGTLHMTFPMRRYDCCLLKIKRVGQL